MLVFIAACLSCATATDAPAPEELRALLREGCVSSSADGVDQPVLFYAPREARGPVPLLVSLHSWSTTYDKYGSLDPALAACVERGWAFVSPHFRGPNDRPEACGSDLAVQDVRDAVAYAKEQTRIDADRLYLVGVSGGGHMALVMAHRAPELWAAVSAWVPITDIARWHAFSKGAGRKYAKDIEGVLGGPPDTPGRIAEARKRSPLFHLEDARGLPIDIQAGIHDGHDGNSVPIDHTLRAFNVLARANGYADAVLTQADIAYMTRKASVPQHLAEEREEEPGREHPVLFRRSAGPVRVTLFDGPHTGEIEAAVAWLAEHERR